jgi:hypothetical protein
VSEKNAKKPARSVQYLLRADHKLQRVSLKKLSERLAKARRPARSRKVAGPTAAGAKEKEATGHPWGIGSRAIVLGTFGLVVAAAALFAAGQPSSRGDVTAGETPATSAAVKTSPSAPTPKKPAVEPTKAPAAAATTKAPTDSRPKGPAASMTASVESTAKPDARNAASVTITGCLQHDDQTFWLKDASGTDAPKTRSWRSGFLTKRPPHLEVVDAAKTLKLSNYVGQRVAATGALVNRELQARSLRRVAASCN